MKKIITLLMLATLITTSCDKYLDVNINVDAPDRIEAHQYLAGILSSYQGAYWDIRALGPLTQMMGTSGYQSYASNYYSAGSDAAAEVWRMTYWMQGMNLENLIKQAEDAENWTLAGIGYTIKAYSWDMMAKLQVDLPLEDAYKPGLLAHRYDYQDKVYEAVRGWASKAIECFQKEDLTVYGNITVR